MFCQQTHNTVKTHSYYHLVTAERTTLHSHKNRPHAPDKTYEGSVACYLSSVITHSYLIVYQVCRDVGRSVKSGSCSLSSFNCEANGQYWLDT